MEAFVVWVWVALLVFNVIGLLAMLGGV